MGDSLEIYGEVEEIVGGEGLARAIAAFAGVDLLVVLDAVVVQHVEQQLLAATNKRSPGQAHKETDELGKSFTQL